MRVSSLVKYMLIAMVPVAGVIVIVIFGTTTFREVSDTSIIKKQKILSRAQQGDFSYVGISGEEWVQTVVSDASSGTVPQIRSSDGKWTSWVYHVKDEGSNAMSGGISKASPGDIMYIRCPVRWNEDYAKMLNKNKLHAAIIVSIFENSVLVIESLDGIVLERTIPREYLEQDKDSYFIIRIL